MQLGDLCLKGEGEATPFPPVSLCWLQWGGRSAGGAARTEQQARRNLGSWRQGPVTPAGSLRLTVERKVNIRLI